MKNGGKLKKAKENIALSKLFFRKKDKKRTIFLFLFLSSLVFVSSFLLSYAIFSKPIIAEAAKNDYRDLAGCTPQFKNSADSSGITFGTMSINDAGKQIKISATIDSATEGYVFNWKELDKVTSSVTNAGTIPGSVPVTSEVTTNYYVYKFNDSSLRIHLDGNDEITSMQITDYDSSTNEKFKKFAVVFNQKFAEDYIKNNMDHLSCSQESLFGSDLDASITFHGTNAPTIDLPGSSEKNRPDIRFKLKYAFNKGGFLTYDDDVFIFTAQELFGTSKNNPSYEIGDYINLTIVVLNKSGKAFPSKCGDLSTYQDCIDYTDTNITISEDSLRLFYNHVYNGQPTDSSKSCGDTTEFKKAGSSAKEDSELSDWPTGNNPPLDCLNISSNGWLAKWGVTVKSVSLINPTGEQDACGTTNITAVFEGNVRIADVFRHLICNMALLINDFADGFATGAAKAFSQVVGFDDSKY